MELLKDMIQVYEEYALANNDNNVVELVNRIPIERKVEVFNLYKNNLKGKSCFLDWGCKDGHDGYMIASYLQEPEIGSPKDVRMHCNGR